MRRSPAMMLWRAARGGPGSRRGLPLLLSAASGLSLAACETEPVTIGRGVITSATVGSEPCDAGTSVDAGDCSGRFTGRIRDFRSRGDDRHPDFGDFDTPERRPVAGLVRARLGPDRKPVYAPGDATEEISGRASFDQWFRDVPEVNKGTYYTAPMKGMDQDGYGFFVAREFFPIDGDGWGPEDEIDGHNYGFTYELHLTFQYLGGAHLAYASDDDLWIFVNGQLLVDLGGVHHPTGDIVDLDDHAEELGLVAGEEYPLDVFHAERNGRDSGFALSTAFPITNCAPILFD